MQKKDSKKSSGDFNPQKSPGANKPGYATHGVSGDGGAKSGGPSGKFVGTGANKPGYAVRGVGG